VIQEPHMGWLESSGGAFRAPPGSAKEIVAAMVSMRRELNRDAITLDKVIGLNSLLVWRYIFVVLIIMKVIFIFMWLLYGLFYQYSSFIHLHNMSS
jgi:hypothetical protein